MNSFCVKAKLQNGQFKSFKLIFCKFKGEFELEGQGQGHQFLKYLDLQMINKHVKFEAKIPNGSNRITQNF